MKHTEITNEGAYTHNCGIRRIQAISTLQYNTSTHFPSLLRDIRLETKGFNVAVIKRRYVEVREVVRRGNARYSSRRSVLQRAMRRERAPKPRE